MPISNLGKLHLTAAQKTTIDTAIQAIITELLTVTVNLSDDERVKYGSVDEKNKLLVNKVNDYKNVQPSLKSPDVDWVEFDADYVDRVFADTRLGQLNNVVRMLSDFKIVHDYDNYESALLDYKYAQYKSESNAPGFTDKVNELKQFFPRTGNAGTNP